MSLMSTLAQTTGGSCHFYSPDYCQLAYNILPLVARDNYGLVPTGDITAPNVVSAAFTTTNRNQIVLVFNQNMVWTNSITANFYLDRTAGWVAAGSASNNVVTLTLSGSSTNQTIDYVVDQYWTSSATTNLLYGSNGVAALTFYAVPIAPPPVVVAANPPGITSLAPVTGRTNGGTVVTITGTNFLNGASVLFGGNSATAVTVNSATQITVSTSANGSGSVNVAVINTNGLAVTNLNAFTYVLPPVPVPISGNAAQVIGTNLTLVWTGATNQSCVLLMATNILQPRNTWIPVATNSVGPDGYSTNTIPVNTGGPQRYYLLSIPYN